jgi:hypothetical protein
LFLSNPFHHCIFPSTVRVSQRIHFLQNHLMACERRAELGTFGSICEARGAIERGRRALSWDKLCRRFDVAVAPWERPFCTTNSLLVTLSEHTRTAWFRGCSCKTSFKPPFSQQRSVSYLHSAKVPFLSQILEPFPGLICLIPPTLALISYHPTQQISPHSTLSS